MTRSIVKKILWSLLLLLALLAAIRLWPHPPLSKELPLSRAIYDVNGTLLRLTLASDQRFRLWTPLNDISPRLVEAVLLHEDQWFYRHPGFNPASLLRAAFATYATGSPRQGGSTITMQLARLRWRLNTKDISGKLWQIACALQLELCYSKDDILEAYLNYAPYGRNIEGVATAGLIYFNKAPAELSLPELLTLAVMPQAPSARLLDRGRSAISPSLTLARNRLFARWLKERPADIEQAALFELPLYMRQPEKLPFKAPHFTDQLLTSLNRRQFISGSDINGVVISSLDMNLQDIVNERLNYFIEQRASQGVKNAAALLVDSRDMTVRALVGSADYFNKEISGQVNGASAKRSPGSILKPFIYALALEQGIVHPLTMLKDVPSSFGPYAPENYDSHFMGPLSATQALVRSRNIPAVQIAARLENPNLYGFLEKARISELATEKHYGLALVLGGGALTMQEIARLYAMLINQGIMYDLRLQVEQKPSAPLSLLSPQAAFVTLQMLAHNFRPDHIPAATQKSFPAFWKTGTSWGFRDAWSAGIWGPYVLVVWVGNFDSQGNPAFLGVSAAAPLFFSILDSIRLHYPELQGRAPVQPEGVKMVEVCAISGDLSNAWCPQKTATWFIPGKSPIMIDSIHRQVVVDKASGLAACPPYDPRTTRLEVHEFWPSDLLEVFDRVGLDRRPPAIAAGCGHALATPQGLGPHITSPRAGSVYTLRNRDLSQENIALVAINDAAVKTNFWFSGGNYLGQAPAGRPLYWQPRQAGHHELKVVDDHGRNHTRELIIEVTE